MRISDPQNRYAHNNNRKSSGPEPPQIARWPRRPQCCKPRLFDHYKQVAIFFAEAPDSLRPGLEFLVLLFASPTDRLL